MDFKPLEEEGCDGSSVPLHPGPLPDKRYKDTWSVLTWSWYNTLLTKGLKRPLEHADTWDIRPAQTAADLSVPVMGMVKVWDMFRHSQVFGLYIRCGIMRAVTELGTVMTPVLLNQLMRCIADKDNAFAASGEHSEYEGYALGCLMFIAAILTSLSLNHYIALCFESGAHARAMMMHMIFAKALKLDGSTVQEVSAGQLINLMSKDASKLQEFTLFGHNLWSAPTTAVWVICGLYFVLGWPAAAGIFITIFLVPIQSQVARKSQKFRKEYMQFADQRLKILGRVIEGIRLIKLSAWEREVLGKLTGVRKCEIESIRSSSQLLALNHTLMDASPIVVALATFTIYTLAGFELDADQVFTALALFNLLGHPFHVLPKSISLLSDLRVTVDRLEAFFSLPDKAPFQVAPGPPRVLVSSLTVGWRKMSSAEPPATPAGKGQSKGGGAGGVLVESFKRARQGQGIKVVLTEVDLEVGGGQLLVVVGAVGCGKSTLLAGLVGEASTSKGSSKITGKGIGYLPQVPWVRNGTIRENVVMSWAWDQVRFKQVVSACALDEDIASLPDGELTEVGERGITLSGGQRQRISLARAFYASADVCVLDCPLASLDSRTARHVFEQGVMTRIVGQGGACVMASNSAWMVERADVVAVLEGGKCRVGTLRELRSAGVNVDRYLDKDDDQDAIPGVASESDDPAKPKRAGDEEKKGGGAAVMGGSKSKVKKAGKKEEEKGSGRVGWRVYAEYCSAASVQLVLVLCVCACSAQLLSVLKDVVLAKWSGSIKQDLSIASNLTSYASETPPDAALQSAQLRANMAYLELYAACACAAIVLSGLRSFAMAATCLSASQSLHDVMVDRVLRAPMRFFETTPVGHITNRFSSDTDSLDFSLPNAISMWIDAALTMGAAVCLLASQAPLMIVVFIALFFAYKHINTWFGASATNLKRIESITKSPVFTAFSQMVEGLSSIRALDLQEHLIQTTSASIDINTAAYLSWAHCNRWLGVRLDLLGGAVVFCTAVMCVHFRSGFGETGLLLIYAITLTRTIAVSIRSTTQMEMQFSAVERIKEYTQIEPECDDQHDGRGPPDGWPTAGEIVWDNVRCRYLEDQPEALRGVSVRAMSGQCVGICGRTGAGKSSMLMALLRVLRCTGGQVRIDGVDVSKVSLHRLRSSVGIIPQDPVQIAASVREALDPSGGRTDTELNAVLTKVGLCSDVSLNNELKEGGGNLSVGQRQLLCLARALLDDKKILLLDEATAHVDEDTADRLRECVLALRGVRTVIVIAHRLEDVAVCDQVVVMDRGNVAQFGTPLELLDNKDGEFASLAQELGIKVADRIRMLASEGANSWLIDRRPSDMASV